MKQKQFNIYCDMDGVIANFNGVDNAIKRYEKEKGFFQLLKPLNSLGFTYLLNLAKTKKIKLYVLSASPNRNADKDKLLWLKKYYPQLKKRNIIIIRNGKNKANYVKNKKANNVLFDDYGKNINDFINKGYKGIKITQNKNIMKAYFELLYSKE